MNSEKQKICIAGHKGMVGSGVWRLLEAKGYSNLIWKSSNELDLINQAAVQGFIEIENQDFVIAKGKTNKVRNFIQKTFAEVGFQIRWQGNFNGRSWNIRSYRPPQIPKGITSTFKNPTLNDLTLNPSVTLSILPPGTSIIHIDLGYSRRTEVDLLIGNPSKAKAKLGSGPKIGMGELIKEMVEKDLKKERNLKDRAAN